MAQKQRGHTSLVRDIETWFFMYGNRKVVSAVLIVFIFLLTSAVSVFIPSVSPFLLYGSPTPGTGLLYFIAGIITLITIVLTINQLVLSYQLGPIKKQETSVQSLLSHRQKVRSFTGASFVSEKPAAFLSLLAMGILEQIEMCEERLQTASLSDTEKERLETYFHDTRDIISTTRNKLEDVTFHSMLFIEALESFRSPYILREFKDIQQQSSFPEPLSDSLDDLDEGLQLLAHGTEYFKMGNLQRQFLEFSRALLYMGLPALLFTFYSAVIYHPQLFPGITLGVPNMVWFTNAAVAIAVSPIVFLISYMSRIITVTKTTIFTGPSQRGHETSPFLRKESL